MNSLCTLCALVSFSPANLDQPRKLGRYELTDLLPSNHSVWDELLDDFEGVRAGKEGPDGVRLGIEVIEPYLSFVAISVTAMQPAIGP